MVLREAVLLTVMSLLSGCAAVGRIAEQRVRLRSAAARMLLSICAASLFLCFHVVTLSLLVYARRLAILLRLMSAFGWIAACMVLEPTTQAAVP